MPLRTDSDMETAMFISKPKSRSQTRSQTKTLTDLLSQHMKSRRKARRTKQESIHDTICYLSFLPRDWFFLGIQILRSQQHIQKEDILYRGPREICVIRSPSSKGQTIDVDKAEMITFVANAVIGEQTRRKVGEIPRAVEDSSCAICREELPVDAEVVVLSCGHWFCVECIHAWMGVHATCPMCRRPVEPAPDTFVGVWARDQDEPNGNGRLVDLCDDDSN